MLIPVRKSDAACGAEIAFDLSTPINEPTFGAIEQAFHDNIVVFFRDQRLTDEQHIAFSRRFGELEIHIVKKYLLPGHPEILLISNVRTDEGEHIGLADAGFTWHTDTSYRRPRPKLTAAQLAETPDIAHPIVRTHPYTGRKALYLTEGECIGIEGMPEDEALDLIAELDAFCVRPEFCYRHRWRVGDLVMWDNASAMHLAICDYALPERRLMHRTTVIGSQPF